MWKPRLIVTLPSPKSRLYGKQMSSPHISCIPNGPDSPRRTARMHATYDTARDAEFSASNVRSLTTDEGVQRQSVQHVMTCRRAVSARAKTHVVRMRGETERGVLERARLPALARIIHSLALVSPRVGTEIIVVVLDPNSLFLRGRHTYIAGAKTESPLWAARNDADPLFRVR